MTHNMVTGKVWNFFRVYTVHIYIQRRNYNHKAGFDRIAFSAEPTASAVGWTSRSAVFALRSAAASARARLSAIEALGFAGAAFADTARPFPLSVINGR